MYAVRRAPRGATELVGYVVGARGPPAVSHGLGTVGGPGSAPSVLHRPMYRCERASCHAGVPGSCHKAGGDGATQTSGPPASPVMAQAASVPSLHTAVAIQRVGFQQAIQQAGPLSTAAGPGHSPAHRQLPGVLTLAWALGTACWRRAPMAKAAVNLLEADARDVLAWPGLAPDPSLAQGRHRPAHGGA